MTSVRGSMRVGVLLLVLVQLLIEQSLVAAEPRKRGSNTCKSIGGLKFDSSQRPQQRSKGLEVCSKYKKNTCCNETHTRFLKLKIKEPVAAVFNSECQRITEEMTCAACHPFVGTGAMRNVCPQLCEKWFRACRREFYAYGGDGTLTPCYGNALVCSPLSSIASNGADFCDKMGYHVGHEDDVEGTECFDGSAPTELGEAEPSEPLMEVLKRVWEEQSQNPSDMFMAGLFFSVIVVYMSHRWLRQWRSASSPTLTIEEVRRLQQEAYSKHLSGTPGAEDIDDDSDFSDSSDVETNDPNGEKEVTTLQSDTGSPSN